MCQSPLRSFEGKGQTITLSNVFFQIFYYLFLIKRVFARTNVDRESKKQFREKEFKKIYLLLKTFDCHAGTGNPTQKKI
jgi:hypothetical protein